MGGSVGQCGSFGRRVRGRWSYWAGAEEEDGYCCPALFAPPPPLRPFSSSPLPHPLPSPPPPTPRSAPAPAHFGSMQFLCPRGYGSWGIWEIRTQCDKNGVVQVPPAPPPPPNCVIPNMTSWLLVLQPRISFG